MATIFINERTKMIGLFDSHHESLNFSSFRGDSITDEEAIRRVADFYEISKEDIRSGYKIERARP